eukprot:1139251-Pelagomonas_calceolata.AAC.5
MTQRTAQIKADSLCEEDPQEVSKATWCLNQEGSQSTTFGVHVKFCKKYSEIRAQELPIGVHYRMWVQAEGGRRGSLNFLGTPSTVFLNFYNNII